MYEINLTDMIIFDEGFRQFMYKDTEGYWTIGVGHLLTKQTGPQSSTVALQAIKELGGTESGFMSIDLVKKVLAKDLQRTIDQLEKHYKTKDLALKLKSSQPIRYNALINMSFQLGVAGVAGFTKSLALLNESKWNEAAAELLNSRWARQTPKRAIRVTDVIRTGTTKLYQ